jgi:hypothetical protein
MRIKIISYQIDMDWEINGELKLKATLQANKSTTRLDNTSAMRTISTDMGFTIVSIIMESILRRGYRSTIQH